MRSPDPLAGFHGPTCKGREGLKAGREAREGEEKGKGRGMGEGRGGEGIERREREGKEEGPREGVHDLTKTIPSSDGWLRAC